MKIKTIAIRFILPVSIILIWELSFRFGLLDSNTFSAPSLILKEMIKVVISGELLTHSLNSLGLIISALIISCLIAIPLGIAMGVNSNIKNLLDPIIEFIRPLPPLALLPLAIIWLGIGVSEKLFILTIGTFPPVLINTFQGVKNLDPVLVQAAKSMGCRTRDILWKVIIPSALPSMFTGMRIAIGFAFTVIVAAELVATRNGLGYLLTIGWRTYNLELIFVSIITIGSLAYLMELVLRIVRKRVIPWENK